MPDDTVKMSLLKAVRRSRTPLIADTDALLLAAPTDAVGGLWNLLNDEQFDRLRAADDEEMALVRVLAMTGIVATVERWARDVGR